ncbi:polygalacturonase [Encephalitozoon cuniculi]|nr:polygalacturonase [Encephalitozoon cuniculi]
MEKNYIDRVRRALEVVPEDRIEERKRTIRNKTHSLIITERTYSINWDQTFSTNHKILYPKEFIGELGEESEYSNSVVGECGSTPIETDNPDNVYYEAQCLLGGEMVARFTISGDALLSDLAELLVGGDVLSSKVFFAIGKTIYLRDIDDNSVRFATMVFQLKVFGIKKWDIRADRCIEDISKEIHFHDGRFLKSIQITRVFFSHRKISPYISVKRLHGRAQLCKCCLKNNAGLKVINDPILPEKKKFVCKRCFELLFVDKEGNNRYDDIEVEFLH